LEIYIKLKGGNQMKKTLSESILKNIKNNKSINMLEAIEQKYEKSNHDFNSFLKDVKRYTGSYDYLFGGKVVTEWAGYPVTIKYFYYERPYYPVTYNLVVNVLTPMGVSGDSIQEAIDNEIGRLETRMSNGEIKEKILQIVTSLN
jgi:hypothetical protein